MTPHTRTLYSGTLSASADGNEFSAVRKDGRDKILVTFSITAGDGVLSLYGRNGPDDEWHYLSATDAGGDDFAEVAFFPYLRASFTQGSGSTTFRVMTDVLLKQVT